MLHAIALSWKARKSYLVMTEVSKRERDFPHEELFQGWDGELSGTAGQRKLEGNQKETPLRRVSLCQSPTA